MQESVYEHAEEQAEQFRQYVKELQASGEYRANELRSRRDRERGPGGFNDRDTYDDEGGSAGFDDSFRGRGRGNIEGLDQFWEN